MEHLNSTAIAATNLDGAISIAAHEFFHVWNVKRIRPQSLEPVDYTKEQYTRALWFAEGVTDAYCSFTLERTGLWSKKQFYDDLASQIQRIQSRPAHAWQSVEESSLDAWYEKYEAYNRRTAVFRITTRARLSARCSISQFATRPTTTNRSTTFFGL